MTTLMQIKRTPDIISTEINTIKDKTRKMVLDSSIEIGDRLVEAKELISHGEWEEWLKSNVEYSVRTAQDLMRIAREYTTELGDNLGANSKTQAPAFLGYTQAVQLLSLPDDERQAFIDNGIDEEMSTRELREKLAQKDDDIEALTASMKDLGETNAGLAKEKDEIQIRKNDELTESRTKSKQLSKEIEGLKSKLEDQVAVDAEAIKKDVAAEYLKKITDLEREKKASENKTKALELEVRASKSAAALKFQFHIDEAIRGFKSLVLALGQLYDEDKETYTKYKGAAEKLIEKLKEEINTH